MEKEKIAFVVQRYGLEINGGAELYCRQVAENLTTQYDVTVFTTCAKDHMSWKNEYREGESELNGVHIRRFPVERERKIKEFSAIYEIVGTNPNHTDQDETEFINVQGPYCPALIESLKTEHQQYRVVFFVTYLYYPTVNGLMLNLNNAALIPTLHDEPAAHLRIFDPVFKNAKAFIWNTEEERIFAECRFPFVSKAPGDVVGLGIKGPQEMLPELPDTIKNENYIVYAGRIETGKGCDELFRYFKQYKKQNGGDLKLVLMGKAAMDIPKDSDIVSLGFVSEAMKFAVMRQARALVLFSRFESLSMVVLESMLMGRPVLVTDKSNVLKGHCIRSNAGLYFENYEEFEGELNYLLSHPEEFEIMCRNGIRYVKQNYQWDVIIRKYQAIISDPVFDS